MTRKAVWAAMPPTALETASEARPAEAAVSDVTMPEREVLAPRRTPPKTASPRPVRSANLSAVEMMRIPASVTMTVAARKTIIAICVEIVRAPSAQNSDPF